MRLYKIYTYNINHVETVKLITAWFPEGFTLITGEGYYEGSKEHCLIIDIVTNKYHSVLDLAYAIKKQNKQKSVLVVNVHSDMKLIQ